jgi:hypothetical protein
VGGDAVELQLKVFAVVCGVEPEVLAVPADAAVAVALR